MAISKQKTHYRIGIPGDDDEFERLVELHITEAVPHDDASDAKLVAKHFYRQRSLHPAGESIVVQRSDDFGETWGDLPVMQQAMIEIHSRDINGDPQRKTAALSGSETYASKLADRQMRRGLVARNNVDGRKV